MMRHLPILVLAFPLLAAPLCLALHRLCAPWLVAIVATSLSLITAIAMFVNIIHDGAITYYLGGWSPPWGVEFKVDLLNAPLVILLTGVATVVVLYARYSREIPAARQVFFYILLLLCSTGLLGMTITNDIFNAFVFMEVSALSSYGLVALSRGRDAPLAAFHYLVMGSVGATFFLIGTGYIYMLTGTLNYTDISLRLPGLLSSHTLIAALAFIAIGLAMKIAIFPLHTWLPLAYAQAPTAATGFMASVSTKIALYLFIRLFLGVFGLTLFSDHLHLDTILITLSSVAMVYASWRALHANQVKQMMAFSSVSQIAYITLAISLATHAGLTAGLIQVFSHALTKGGIFLALGCILFRNNGHGDFSIENLTGLGRSSPLTAMAITVGGLSLIGIPLTSGFVGKWHLILALIDAGLWPLLVFVLISSLLAVCYVWRLVEAMYFTAEPPAKTSPVPRPLILSSWIMLGAVLYLGLFSESFVMLMQDAAATLLSS